MVHGKETTEKIMEENITNGWTELKQLISEYEVPVLKNASGVSSAGVEARKGLRLLKVKAAELVKLMIVLDKARKTERAGRREAKKAAAEAATPAA